MGTAFSGSSDPKVFADFSPKGAGAGDERWGESEVGVLTPWPTGFSSRHACLLKPQLLWVALSSSSRKVISCCLFRPREGKGPLLLVA